VLGAIREIAAMNTIMFEDVELFRSDPAEETLPDKLVEQHLACRHIDLPQPACLRERHSQPGHLEVFTPNASDKRFKRRLQHVCAPFAGA
jgi:hypothetical protein